MGAAVGGTSTRRALPDPSGILEVMNLFGFLVVRRGLLAVLLAMLLAASGGASAHPTIVLGELSSDPVNPAAGEAFVLRMALDDPAGLPVGDAFVLAELHVDPEHGEPVVVQEFGETDQPGVYLTQIVAPDAGTYTLKLRDQTYRQEETSAAVAFEIGGSSNPAVFDFFFPPTPITRSLGVWLFWLIGLPIVAGIVVTVLVLASPKQGDAGTDPAGEPPPDRA